MLNNNYQKACGVFLMLSFLWWCCTKKADNSDDQDNDLGANYDKDSYYGSFGEPDESVHNIKDLEELFPENQKMQNSHALTFSNNANTVKSPRKSPKPAHERQDSWELMHKLLEKKRSKNNCLSVS